MSGSSKSLASTARTSAAIILSLLLPGQLGWAQSNAEPGAPSVKLGVPKIDADKTGPDPHILHLLSRFTFGPTSDEAAAVRARGKNGIDKWFDEQLRPDNLPQTPGDRFLATQLAEHPELQLQADELLVHFPSGAIIRQTANGKLPIPDDPYLYAIYRRHIDLYEAKQAKKEQGKADAAKPELPKTPASGQEMAAMPGKPETATPQPPEAVGPPISDSAKANTSASAIERVPDTARPTYSDLLAKSVFALPPNQRLHRILNMRPAEYEQFQASVRGPQRVMLLQQMNPAERELLADFENPTHTVVEALQGQRLLRDIYSSHQLQEVMTTFWLNHFNIYLHKNEETPYYLVSYERDVIRPRALGNFEDLLIATAESPAMLLYLDNSSSTGPDSIVSEKQKERAAAGKPAKATPPGLNENYARELMELHTLGVNGGYTQKDVTEVAKVFTGWTVDKPQLGGDFKFDESRHEPGKKIVMGHKIKENGQKEGLQLLHILATSPATAHFISQELAVAFVSDTPPAALINRMAAEFTKTHGDIALVLRTMLHSPEFWAPSTYQAKVKTPLEYVASAARASGANIVSVHPLIEALNQMGMPLYGCVPPTGYSDKADAWVSTGELVTRMNFALSLATNHFGGIKSQWMPPSQSLTNPVDTEQTLESRLIPSGVSEKTRAAVLEQAQNQQQPLPQMQVFPEPVDAQSVKAKQQNQKIQEQQNAQIAGLLLGSPEFQRR